MVFFAGAAIIVLEVAIGSVIEKDIFSRLLYTFFVLAVDSFLLAILTINKKSPRQSGGFVAVRDFRVCWRRSDTAEYRKENQG